MKWVVENIGVGVEAGGEAEGIALDIAAGSGMVVAEAVVMQAGFAIVVLAGEAVVVGEGTGGLGVAEGLGIPAPGHGAVHGGRNMSMTLRHHVG
jgi:hypothetical protein